jgi:hypothetical protein
MTDFSTQVGKWCDLAGERARLALIAIAFAAQQAVKQKTPVRTGYLRANWQIVRGNQAIPVERTPREKIEKVKDRGVVADTVIAQASASIAGNGAAVQAMETIVRAAGNPIGPENDISKVELGDVVQIVNPTSYARYVEFGRQIVRKDGTITHTRAAGMVQKTLAEMPDIAARAIAPFIRSR